MSQNFDETTIYTLSRPHPKLRTYYILSSIFWGPLFFIRLGLNLVRYATMQYSFDEKGVSMRWGRLVKREISLRYTRIQDIHLSSNILERHLNLARIELQTASAQSKAEMTIEGFMEFEAIRDFLYSKMHGSDIDSGQSKPNEAGQSATPSISLSPAEIERLNSSLQATTEALREVRLAMQEQRDSDVEKTD